MAAPQLRNGKRIVDYLQNKQESHPNVDYYWIPLNEVWSMEMSQLESLDISLFDTQDDSLECQYYAKRITQQDWKSLEFNYIFNDISKYITSLYELHQQFGLYKFYPKSSYSESAVVLLLSYWLDAGSSSENNSKENSFVKLKVKPINYYSDCASNPKESQWSITTLPKNTDLDSIYEAIKFRVIEFVVC